MLLLSMKINRKLIKLVCCVLGAGLLVLGISSRFFDDVQKTVSISGEGAVTKNYTVTTDEQRLAFIAQFGWEVNAEPCEIREVILPKEFDQVYQNYNDIQKAQGLDMSRYAGKAVKRYTYQVLNYPAGDEEVRLNLLTAENKVIGGDVCSLALDGFMHGFRYEEMLSPGDDAVREAVPLPSSQAE